VHGRAQLRIDWSVREETGRRARTAASQKAHSLGKKGAEQTAYADFPTHRTSARAVVRRFGATPTRPLADEAIRKVPVACDRNRCTNDCQMIRQWHQPLRSKPTRTPRPQSLKQCPNRLRVTPWPHSTTGRPPEYSADNARRRPQPTSSFSLCVERRSKETSADPWHELPTGLRPLAF
jgi:hypothetical protein